MKYTLFEEIEYRNKSKTKRNKIFKNMKLRLYKEKDTIIITDYHELTGTTR